VSTSLIGKRRAAADELTLLPGPITRLRAKKFKESLQTYMGRMLEGMEAQDAMKTNGASLNQIRLDLQDGSSLCLIHHFKLMD
jgi:hypothetical protein